MLDLTSFQYFIIGYISLYLVKVIISISSIDYLVQRRIDRGVLVPPKEWKMEGYKRTVVICYSIGAALVLIITLIPTFLKEGLSFFRKYDKKKIDRIADRVH